MRPKKQHGPISMTVTLRLTAEDANKLDYLISDKALTDVQQLTDGSVSTSPRLTRPDFLKFIINKAYNNRVKATA
jgi:hypothetical protein